MKAQHKPFEILKQTKYGFKITFSLLKSYQASVKLFLEHLLVPNNKTKKLYKNNITTCLVNNKQDSIYT